MFKYSATLDFCMVWTAIVKDDWSIDIPKEVLAQVGFKKGMKPHWHIKEGRIYLSFTKPKQKAKK